MKEKNMSNDEKTINPYLDGRREWNERYGSYISRARNWRVVALIATTTALLTVGGIVYLASKTQVKPYIVMVDSLGQVASVGYMPELKVTEKVVKASLSQFVVNLRTIYPDDYIQKQHIFNVYRYLAKSLPATKLVDKYYKENPPFNHKYFQQVKVENIISTAPNQWQLDWSEERYDENGNFKASQTFRTVLEIVFKTQNTDAEIIKNPVGIFIKNIKISKIMTK